METFPAGEGAAVCHPACLSLSVCLLGACGKTGLFLLFVLLLLMLSDIRL